MREKERTDHLLGFVRLFLVLLKKKKRMREEKKGNGSGRKRARLYRHEGTSH